MKYIRRAVCLCLCLCMVFCLQASVLAISSGDLLKSFFEQYDGLLDGTLSSLETGTDSSTFSLSLDDAVADKLKEHDLSALGKDLKELLSETAGLTDGELDNAIREVGEAHQITLTNSQIAALRTLCRSMEQLDTEELQEKAQSAKEYIEKYQSGMEKVEKGKEFLEQNKGKIDGVLGWLKQLAQKVTAALHTLFERIS